MKLADLTDRLGLHVRTAQEKLAEEVTGGYASDLLSDVLAHGRSGDVWVTLQAHQNVVAVASLRGIVGIILVAGRQPEAETIEKAEAEHIPILVGDLPAFEIVGKLYELGIRGGTEG